MILLFHPASIWQVYGATAPPVPVVEPVDPYMLRRRADVRPPDLFPNPPAVPTMLRRTN